MSKVKAQVVTLRASKLHDVFVIEINLTIFLFSTGWLDISSCANIYSNVHALSNKKLLGKGEMLLQVGNGVSVVVAVGDLDLYLHSGLIL
jgi:hypothetical protein